MKVRFATRTKKSSWFRPFVFGVAVGCSLTGLMVGISTINTFQTITEVKETVNTANEEDDTIMSEPDTNNGRAMLEFVGRTEKKGASFSCEGVSQQEHVGILKKIGISGLEPFEIEVYRSNDIVSDHILKLGAWDSSKLNLFQNIVRSYSTAKDIPIDQLTFVDIGGNIGWFSLSMAAMGLEVLTFEPMTSNIDMIKRSLCTETNLESGVSGRVTLFPFGLGPKEESCFVISHDINEGDGHTLCGKSESEIKVPSDYSIRGKIITKRLDDVVSSEGKKIVLVKMDVEGYEANVVEGGRSFLLDSKIPYIVTEFVPQWIREKEGNPERMMERFYDAGYKVLKDGNHVPREQALKMQGIHHEGDDVMFELVENTI